MLHGALLSSKTMKTITLAFAVLAASLAADPAYAETSVAQPLIHAHNTSLGATYTVSKPDLMQVGPVNPLPIGSFLEFTPGSNWSINGVAIPPKSGQKHWPSSACVGTALATLAFSPRMGIETDVLGGITTALGLTGGYALDLYASGVVNVFGHQWTLKGKLGGANMFGSGPGVLGVNGSVSVVFNF